MTDQPYDDTNMSGVPLTDRGTWMQVQGGRVFYPMDPRANEVFLEDIGFALARINRFNGHADQCISVAQHLCQCQWMAYSEGYGVRVQYAVLMHDAAEAFIGDMVRPLKVYMADFKQVELKVMAAIMEALDVPKMDDSLIKRFDNFGWAWEKRDCFKSAGEWPNTPKLPDYLYTMKPWTTDNAYRTFMNQAVHLRVASNAMQALEDQMYSNVPEDDEDDPDDTGLGYSELRDQRDWRDV